MAPHGQHPLIQPSLQCLLHFSLPCRPGFPGLHLNSEVALSSRGPSFSRVNLKTRVGVCWALCSISASILPLQNQPLEKPLSSLCLLATSSLQPWSRHQHLVLWVSHWLSWAKLGIFHHPTSGNPFGGKSQHWTSQLYPHLSPLLHFNYSFY